MQLRSLGLGLIGSLLRMEADAEEDGFGEVSPLRDSTKVGVKVRLDDLEPLAE